MPDFFHIPRVNEPVTRVLLCGHAFPLPQRSFRMWSVCQAAALQGVGGLNVRALALIPAIPRLFRFVKPLRGYATCPPRHQRDGATIEYMKWAFFPLRPLLRRLGDRYWRAATRLAIASVKKRVDRLLSEFSPHLIITNSTRGASVLARRIKAERGIPYIVCLNSLDELDDSRSSPALEALFDMVISHSAAVIGLSNRIVEEVRQRWPNLPAYSVPYGSHDIGAEKVRLARSARQEPTPLRFLIAGTMLERKCFPMTVDAFAAVAARYPDVRLRIAGSGPQMPLVKARIKQHGLAATVDVLGRLDHNQLMDEMLACDVFVLPSFNEAQGVVYVEALSAGAAIICCRDGGAAEFIVDGQQGRVIPPKSPSALQAALIELASNRDRLRVMGVAARSLYERMFTPACYARAVTEILAAHLPTAL